MYFQMEAFPILFLFIFLSSILKACIALDTIIPTHSIKDGDTVISAGGSFEVGFFSAGTSNNRYLGIGYKKISSKTVVWVANRETPLGDHSGILSISNQGILVLSNGTGSIFWRSSNTSSTTLGNPAARLLDSGNLVVQDNGGDNNTKNFLWQSFDYPCDTLLPGMKLRRNFETGLNRYLSSSKSTEDPARGDFSLRIDLHGFPQLLLTKGQTINYRAGSWDGIDFTGLSWLHPEQFIKLEFMLNENEVYYKYELLNTSAILRIKMIPTGNLQVDGWKDGINDWELLLSLPVDRCDHYALCGANTNCNMMKSPICACLEGFVPKGPKSAEDWNLSDWSEGCIRRTPLGCDNINGTTDGFFKYTGVKLPDTSSSWFNKTMSLKECEILCLKNCSCVAYANSDIRGGGSGCLLWFGNLIDIRVFPDGWQDLYIRVVASELDHIVKKRHSGKKKAKIIGASWSIILVTGMLLIIGLVLYIRKKKLIKQGLIENGRGMDSLNEDGNEDLELPTFDLITIANATDNFSSNKKLGEGGFGLVYKGTLDGQEIAVKRLSKNSGQGQTEFKNEVILIAKLQHRNLVKLLGCCIQGEEKMLIYEFMPNKSLDFFIFDQTKRKLLDWRMRINIIGGIARGLLYLHHDSRLRIIHRDLKASNVLLDNNMNPKISDFGLARTFGLDQTSANTNRVVGTYGYMSPEYAVDGLFSIKSDVFSFGVLVLEILSGEKNRGFSHLDHQLNLVGHAWRLWIDGKALELLDKSLGESCNLSELLRCIHVGLLCVQQKPEDRPNISSVVLMLSSEGLLPQPKQPGFYIERNPTEANSSSSKHESRSVNEITFTSLEPR